MKILVSDSNAGHAATMEANILSICPTADVDIRIETFTNSVAYAISDGTYNGICRATTGLSDLRIETDGRDANDNGIWVVHAHAGNTLTEYADPSYIGSIIAVRGITNSYGPGVEFTTDDTTESNATSFITGMIAQMLVVSSSWSIYDARQALRQTANSWSAGWGKTVGFGQVDWQSGLSMSQGSLLPVNSIGDLQFSIGYGYLSASWKSFITESGYQYVVSIYTTAPTLASGPTSGTILWTGSPSESLCTSSLEGDYYGSVFVSGSYSRLESYTTGSFTLLGPFKTLIENKEGAGYTIKIYRSSISNPITIK